MEFRRYTSSTSAACLLQGLCAKLTSIQYRPEHTLVSLDLRKIPCEQIITLISLILSRASLKKRRFERRVSLSTNYIKPPNAELRLKRLLPELFRDVRRDSEPSRVFCRVGAMLKSLKCSRKGAYHCTRAFRKPTGARWCTRWWALAVRMKVSLRSRCNGFPGWCSGCCELGMCHQKLRMLKIEPSPCVKKSFYFLEEKFALQLPWSTLCSPPLLLPPLLWPKAPADDDDDKDETLPTAPADNDETDLVKPADKPLREAPKECPMELEWKIPINCFPPLPAGVLTPIRVPSAPAWLNVPKRWCSCQHPKRHHRSMQSTGG